jgi:hypothetical protein
MLMIEFLSGNSRSFSARDASNSSIDFRHDSDSESSDSMPVERNESRISIIELTEISVSVIEYFLQCMRAQILAMLLIVFG